MHTHTLFFEQKCNKLNFQRASSQSVPVNMLHKVQATVEMCYRRETLRHCFLVLLIRRSHIAQKSSHEVLSQ